MGSFAAGAGTQFVLTSASPVVSGPFTVTAGTATANTPALNVTQTWNNAAVTFTGWQFNVTDTASNAASLLMDLQVGGSTRFNVRKDGTVNLSTNAPYINVPSGFAALQFSGANVLIWQSGAVRVNGAELQIGSTDTILTRDAANTLAQRNGVNPQTFNIYNTFTTVSDYERGRIAWATNVLTIGTEKAGTGTARALDFQTDGTTRISIAAAGTISLSATLQTSGTTSFNGWSAFGGNSGEGLAFGSTSGIRWASSTSTGVFTSGDTGISRKAAKIVEINSGTTGTYAGTAFTTGSQTVAQLPAAATAGAGARAFVTDATATTFLSTVAGGGANAVPVVSNGTNWLIG